MCYQITTMTLARNVNAVRFTSDGSRVRVMSTLNRDLDSLYVSINHLLIQITSLQTLTFIHVYHVNMSHSSIFSLASYDGLDDWGLIPNRGKGFFF
jgi:hypothetical protein